MLYVVLIILGVLAVIALIALVVLRNTKFPKQDLTVRHAISEAKAALLDGKNKPQILRRMKDKSEVPFNPVEENKSRMEIPGTFHLHWPMLEIGYTLKDGNEKIILRIGDYKELITLFYADSVLAAVKKDKETLDTENFEMRHAGTIADHLRSFIRYHLRFPGGSLKVEKSAEPTFTPVLDLNKAGEIKLKGNAPPQRMPNFEE